MEGIILRDLTFLLFNVMLTFNAIGGAITVTRNSTTVQPHNTDPGNMDHSTTVPANATWNGSLPNISFIQPEIWFVDYGHVLDQEGMSFELKDWPAYWPNIRNYSTLHDDDETKDFIMKYPDEFSRQMIATQLSYCPMEQLCSYSLNIEDSRYKSCCSSCSCLPNCTEFGNCCLDMVIEMNIEDDSTTKVCIPMNINTRKTYGAYGIGKCPTASTYIDSEKCEQSYMHDGITMLDTVPVIHVHTNTVFRNMHCALCNGLSVKELDFFEAKLGCHNSIPATIQTDHELIQFVSGSNCDIAFQTDIETEYCTTSITRCNVTKLWRTYDPDIEKACGMYTSLFKVDIVTYFKNIFCALCNGYTDISRSCPYSYDMAPSIPFSFSGLLSYTAPDEDGSKVDTKCNTGYIYHESMDECIQPKCSSLGRLMENKCVPILDIVDSFNYCIVLSLKPSVTHTISEAHSMTEDLLIKVKQFMQTFVEDPYYLQTCEANIMLKSQTSCSQSSSETVLQQKLEYFLLKMAFRITESHHPEDIVSKLSYKITVDISDITGIENETMIVSVTNGFETDFKFGFQSLFTGSTDTPMTFTNNAAEDISTLPSIENSTFNVEAINDTEEHSFLNSIPGITDDHVAFTEDIQPLQLQKEFCCSFDGSILVALFLFYSSVEEPCMDYKPDQHQSIASLLACPVIELPNDTFTWFVNEDGVVFTKSGHVFNHTTFYISPDNSSVIYLCIDNYFDLTNKTGIRWTLTVEHIVSIVCVSLSMLSLLLTLGAFSFLAPLRRSLPGKNNMALVSVLLLAQALYLIGSFSRLEQGSVACIVVGILTHFAWLLVLFWMNICTFHMFHVLTKTKAISRGSGNKRYRTYHIYCFACSGLFVGINILVSSVTSDYDDIGYGNNSCYISSQDMLMYTFGIPLALVIVSNIAMFLVVIVTIKRVSVVQKNVKNERNDIAVFARLSTLTGATWIFGFIYTWTRVEAFSYIFIVLNAGQGVFLFLSFICTRRVIKMASQGYTSSSIAATSSMRQTFSTDVNTK